MARLFALRMQKEAGPNVEKQIEKGYELMLYKTLPKEKLTVFVDLYNEALTEFKSDGDKTKKVMGADSTGTTNPSTAALVVVANAMMNLDEVVMKN